MIEGHEILHRIVHGKKSEYCGYSEATARLTYFKLEPAATEKKPVIWTQFVTLEGPQNKVAARTLRRAPGPDPLTERLDDE